MVNSISISHLSFQHLLSSSVFLVLEVSGSSAKLRVNMTVMHFLWDVPTHSTLFAMVSLNIQTAWQHFCSVKMINWDRLLSGNIVN